MLIKTLAAAAALALSTFSLPAAALGSTVDVNVVDRVTGERCRPIGTAAVGGSRVSRAIAMPFR